jgi:hypothetical protein
MDVCRDLFKKGELLQVESVVQHERSIPCLT